MVFRREGIIGDLPGKHDPILDAKIRSQGLPIRQHRSRTNDAQAGGGRQKGHSPKQRVQPLIIAQASHKEQRGLRCQRGRRGPEAMVVNAEWDDGAALRDGGQPGRGFQVAGASHKDAVGAAKHAPQGGRIELKPPLLPDDIRMVRDRQGDAWLECPGAELSQGIGGVHMEYIGAQTGEEQGLAEAQRHRSHRCQAARPDQGHAFDLLAVGSRARMADQDGHAMPGGGMGLGEDLDVVLNPPQNGIVVLVEVQDMHRWLPSAS